jgi:uncharacterized protein YdeI (YjbR/CyaY-like superfamily)
MTKIEVETFCPKSREDWRNWLIANHQTKDSIWLICYTKKSKQPSVNWSEAVDEALCFGWIDSTRRSIDASSFMQFFCKRKPNSTWSKINKDKVDQLIANGLMKQAGLESIEIAKSNGSWTILDEIEDLNIPEDLERAFGNVEGSKDFFMGLSKSARKLMLTQLLFAKRPETRQKRIAEILQTYLTKKNASDK